MVLVRCSVVCMMLGGCYAEQPPTVDNDSWRWFPLNGARTWTYQSGDTLLPYRVIGTKGNTSEAWGESTVRIHTIDFRYECLGTSAPCDVDVDGEPGPDIETTVAWTWRMSADSSKGALFHAYGDAVFDPPVRIATPSMFVGDVTTTESGGISYVSTYHDQGLCDAPYWRGEPPDDCATFLIEATGGETPLEGLYQTIYQFGVTMFQLDGATEPWRLVGYEDDLG